ncbi:MAG: hypothetical protein CR971_01035 [candidate division SR1 bacterium]|nr:MAG: hypothetical protein CR971_01035 [candidate division SR1 bacterium]
MKKTKISAIVAMAQNRVIGKNNSLPRNYPEDLQYFREMTSGGVIIMGRKTYESIGRPLPNRRNIVISRSGFSDEKYPDLEVYASIDEVLAQLKTIPSPAVGHTEEKNIWVIGGAGIYQQFLEKNLINKLYLTLIKHPYEGDVYFPNFEDNFQEIQREEHENLDFIVYQKNEKT